MRIYAKTWLNAMLLLVCAAFFTTPVIAQDTDQAEEDDYGDRDLEELGEESEITEKKLEEAVKKIDKELSDKPGNKDLKKARKRLTEDYIPRHEKYKKQEEKLK